MELEEHSGLQVVESTGLSNVKAVADKYGGLLAEMA